MKELLYQKIASGIAAMIRKGVLKPGHKLPSVRVLCRDHGVSMNTAKRVFLALEAQMLVFAKPQAGYFVSNLPFKSLPLPAASQPPATAGGAEPAELISKVFANMGADGLTMFSIGVPSGDLIPAAGLRKAINQAAAGLSEAGAAYDSLQGNLKLRKMVAVRSLTWGGELTEDDIITTSGGMNALALTLMALTKAGNTVEVESPCFPGILQLATSLGLNVIELPTHPLTGIVVEDLRKVIGRIDVCLLIPNFNTPLGSCMPDAHKAEVVRLLSRHNIPLIEDDIYGDLYFGTQRPRSCKSYDRDGNVLWCSSISKTLAPGMRVGWVAPGRYKEKLLKLKLVHAISSPALNQEAVGNFMLSGKYESHLRQMRKTLYENYQKYIAVIAEHFPPGTKASRPQGGLALWVELPGTLDAVALHDLAIRQKIALAPGRMFTLQDQFHHCMRLCMGLPWTERVEQDLKKVGMLANMLPG